MSNSTNIYDLKLTVARINSTSIQITLQTFSTLPLLVNKIAFCWLSYSERMLNASNIKLTHGFVVQNQQSQATDVANFHHFNTVCGPFLLSLTFHKYEVQFWIGVYYPQRFYSYSYDINGGVYEFLPMSFSYLIL